MEPLKKFTAVWGTATGTRVFQGAATLDGARLHAAYRDQHPSPLFCCNKVRLSVNTSTRGSMALPRSRLDEPGNRLETLRPKCHAFSTTSKRRCSPPWSKRYSFPSA